MTAYDDLFSGTVSDALRKLACGHVNRTAEDGTGRAICVDCLCYVNATLTKEIFDEAMRLLRDR